jgi:hypothetical protein
MNVAGGEDPQSIPNKKGKIYVALAASWNRRAGARKRIFRAPLSLSGTIPSMH